MFEIKTERLFLRPAKLKDADRMQRILSDFEVAKNLARVPHPYPAKAAIEWIERVQDNVAPLDAKFSIIDRDGQFCGTTGFGQNGDVPRLGYYLDPLHWGKGYMTEACKAAISWIFELADPAFVKSGVYPSNSASMAIQNKLGFVKIGASTVHCLAQNADFEHIDTQLTKDAFVAATQ